MNNFHISSPQNSSLTKTQKISSFQNTQKFLQVSPSPTNDFNKTKQLQVLKPVMNNKHNANKVIAVDLQDHSMSGYRPAFGLRKLSAKINELSQPKKSCLLGKEESSSIHCDSNSKNLSILNNNLNKNHLYSSKASNTPSNAHTKQNTRSQDQGHLREKASLSTFYAKGIKLEKKENYSNASGKMANSRRQKNQFNDLDEHTISISNEMEIKNMNENKQFKNNPLKEITNQVTNLIAFQQKRKSLPFDIQPNPKLNNYFDATFKISEKIENENQPLKFKLQEKNQNEKDTRKKTYEQEKSYFEKKRRSDNTFNDKQLKLDEDILKDIYEKKDTYRKANNISVTTTHSSIANTTASQAQKKGLSTPSYFQNNRKSLLSSRISQQTEQDSVNSHRAVQTLLNNHLKNFQRHCEQIKQKAKVQFSITEIEKTIRELQRNFKQLTSDSTLIFLVKQHNRTHYIAYIFMRLLDEEMKSKNNETISNIMNNVIDQISKNVNIFLEFLEMKQAKKENQNNGNNPFGVNFNHRNSQNKENIPGNRPHQRNPSRSKSELKTKIKFNIQIALAYIKKLCRISKQNQEKFKDLLTILNQIECGAQSSKKVKEEIKRIFHQIRDSMKQSIIQSSQGQTAFSQPRKSLQPRTRETEKQVTVEICEENIKPLIQRSEEESQRSKEQIKRIDRFIKKIEQENSQPNVIEKPGRLTLQPQMTFLKPKAEQQEAQQVAVPQLSIQSLKHQQKFQNNGEPLTVREARPKLKLEQNDDQVLAVPAPLYFNARSSSVPLKEPYLPSEISRGQEYTLVLDLDETLVHFDPKIKTYRPRPGCLKFLHEMCNYFELVVFTAGLKDYADYILNDLDRQHYISHRLYRDHTKYKGGVYVKDLSKLGRDLKKTIIIDNIEENFCEQRDNGIPIKGWYSDPHDREFERYSPFLKGLVQKGVNDVRPEVVKFKKQMHLHMRLYDPIHQHNQEEKQFSTEKKKKSQRRVKSNSNDREGDKENQNVCNQKKSEGGQEKAVKVNWHEEDEEDEDEESEESPPKKKVEAKKEETSEEEEDDEDEESDEDESPSEKKKPPPPKKKEEESDEEEDDEDEEDESEEESPPKKSAQKKPETDPKIKELEEKVEKLEESIEEKDEKLEEKQKDIQKLKDTMMDQDNEITQLKEKMSESQNIIEEKNTIIDEFKKTQESHLEEIDKLKKLIIQMDRFRIEYEKLEDIIKQKEDDIAVLRAKYYLDVVEYKINVVAEYPDLVDENNNLYDEIGKLKIQQETQLKKEEELKAQNLQLTEEGKAKDKRIKQLENHKDMQMKKNKDLLKKLQTAEKTQAESDLKFKQIEEKMKKKNDELEERLESMSKLISKNEQLQQQLRVTKMRLEKFKKESVDQYQKQVSDRDSEIEVLKEMVKGIQLQVRSKDKEINRLKQKVQHIEGQQLANRQQNYMMQSNQTLIQPSSKGSHQRPQLGAIKHPPGAGNRYKMSQLQNSASRPAYPPFRGQLVQQHTPSATYNDQVSNKSMSHSNNEISQRQKMSYVQSQDPPNLHESPRQPIHQAQSKKNVTMQQNIQGQDEYGYSNSVSPEQEREQKGRPIKKNDRSSSFDIAQEVKQTVEVENNETQQDMTMNLNQSNIQQRVISENSPEVFGQDSGDKGKSGQFYQNNQEEADEY